MRKGVRIFPLLVYEVGESEGMSAKPLVMEFKTVRGGFHLGRKLTVGSAYARQAPPTHPKLAALLHNPGLGYF